jgi:hypothetical protein
LLEETPWWRYQYIVFVISLFHLKMACANAIWRIFINLHAARDNVNSLMHFVALNCPWETGKIASNPKFRQVHEVIGHNSIALRLDCWCVEAAVQNPAWNSLESFAKSQPSLKDIEDISNQLAVKYVGGGDNDIFEQHGQPAMSREKICYSCINFFTVRGDFTCDEC